MVAQVHQRRDEIGLESIARFRSRGRPSGHVCHTVLQLQHDTLRRLSADAWHPHQPSDIRPLNRTDQFARLDTGQHRKRELRPDAADADQSLEQFLFQIGEKTEQLERILPHVRVYVQRNGCGDVTDVVVGRQRNGHLVAHAVYVDKEPIRVLLKNLTPEKRDHPSVARAILTPTGHRTARLASG